MLLDAFDSGWIAPAGPHLTAFEHEVAQVCGVGSAVALSSGTAALHLGLEVAGVGPGDQVLVPSFTFTASANPVRYRFAEPVFVDVDPDTWTIDPDLVAEEITRSARAGRPPRALITVDIYGQCADYARLLPICAEYGVAIVEDSCEALGSTYQGTSAGSFGRVAALSFNGNKIITCSGGGMLLTDDAAAADRARHLATQAREPGPHFTHSDIGYNYRLSNLLAALGRAQLARLDERLKHRQHVNSRYRVAFDGVPGVSLMPQAPYGRSNLWLTCLLIDPDAFGAGPEHVRLALERAGIEARSTWKPLHLQKAHRGRRMLGGTVSEDLFARGLCLPSGADLTDDEIDRISAVVLDTAGAPATAAR
jgi:dTDP-4-amino-4,6-dideoxygalactose transaminase